MEKKTYEIKNSSMAAQEKEIKGSNGVSIRAVDHIPYKDKVSFATELTVRTTIMHDDAVAYVGYHFELVLLFLKVKYYTDIDIEGIDEEDLFDFIVNNDLLNEFDQYIQSDYEIVENIYYALRNSSMKISDYDNALTTALKKTLSPILSGDDLTETIAKGEVLQDKLFQAFDALRQKKEKGKININGNMINFKKK